MSRRAADTAAMKWASLGLCAGVLAGFGCGDRITIIECPAGTMPEGSECVPWVSDAEEAPDAGPTDWPTVTDGSIAPDDGVSISPDEVHDAADTLDALETEASGPGPLGATGSPCAKSDDCLGGVCLDWPGGYCTSLDCVQTPCGAGDLCVGLEAGNTACLRACEGTEDCSSGGAQGCKRLTPTGAVAPSGVCHGVLSDASGLGGGCAAHQGCVGAGVCSGLFPGGYCTVEGCDAASCPSEGACVDVSEASLCLLRCEGDGDCPPAMGHERICAEALDVAGAPVSVCASPGGEVPVGGGCTADTLCASGDCEILGEGRCSLSNLPCFTASEAEDCGGSEYCLVTSESALGVCTQTCAVGAGCPGLSFCAGEPGGPEGSCRAPCDGPGDDGGCPAEDGMSCTFGFPLGDSSGQGRYLCVPPQPGGLGSACAPDAPCAFGACSSSDGGLCVSPCGADLYCPFPAVCVMGEGPAMCMRACMTGQDCPDAMSCDGTGIGLQAACQ